MHHSYTSYLPCNCCCTADVMLLLHHYSYDAVLQGLPSPCVARGQLVVLLTRGSVITTLAQVREHMGLTGVPLQRLQVRLVQGRVRDGEGVGG